MRDILPPESGRWRRFADVFADVVERAGYGQLITPLLEDLGVFTRIGDATDVVTKEMYDFVDKGDRHIALRPEMTASVCRAFAEHRPTTPWKVFYSGSNFRYEKPQRGRYRQFDQVGVEVLGADDPNLDVEVIALAWEFYARLGLRQVAADRQQPRRARRPRPLRRGAAASTSSRPATHSASRAGPRWSATRCGCSTPSVRSISRSSQRRRRSPSSTATRPLPTSPTVLAGLRALDIPFTIEPKLVRGLDYYRRTIFEFQGGTLDSAQNALGGGGRYDGLVEALGGPATPGVGFALGVDRTLLACDDEGVFGAEPVALDAFVVDVTGGLQAVALTAELRAAGFAVDRGYDNRSMKAQMKLANRSGARFALIVGDDELAAGTVVVKPMHGDGEQLAVARSEISTHLASHTTTELIPT